MKHWLFVVVLLTSFSLYAQEGDEAESDNAGYPLPAPDWKKDLKKGKVDGYIYSYEAADERSRLASSALEKYPVTHITDNNPSTAWADGVKGSGIGEVVVVEQISDILWIWGGYGKSKELYAANNRPAKIKIYILGTFCHDCTPEICMTSHMVVLATREIVLKDVNAFQSVSLPEFSIKDNTIDCPGRGTDPEQYRELVAIEILSVYRGTKYDDTCITEVMDDTSYKTWLKKRQSK